MAEILTTIASETISKEKSPVLSAPSTDFPYPESKPSDRAQALVGSDATLCEDEGSDQSGELSPRPPRGGRRSDTTKRPRLPPTRGYTEASRPVSVRPVVPRIQRRSTDGRPLQREFNSSSDTLDSFDSTNHTPALKRRKSRIDRGPLAASRLNQVQRHPKRGSATDDRDGRFCVGNEHFHTHGKIAKDGRLNISVNETANSGYLAKALGATINRHLHPRSAHEARAAENLKAQLNVKESRVIPTLNIVIMVIGSRGDIQPFLKIGKILKDKYNHRVRIATHPAFKKFVEDDIGLEFFSVGGDPSELMAFMVKNPGLIPSLETVRAGEIGRRRESMFEMFQGFWRACINATDNERDLANLKMMGEKFPFVADAIIANPPSFAHYHCAEKLGIPLHMVFTFPFSPTQAFPHPLANIKATNVDQNYTNYMSYPLVDLMVWSGLGDLVNRFRVKTLGLEPISTLWAPGQFSRMKVPYTYLWSPGLVPKPPDWGPEIDVAGYVFLDLASSFKPEETLSKFLDRSDGRPIIYIGFGSISGIRDPTAFTKMIFEAVELAEVRALVSRGWGGMGNGLDVPQSVYLLDNIPHDWLFPKVDAVVHHGGAGTTAIGLKCGKPTMIVPFFGDQPFWGAMVVKAGAGAKESLPLKKLSAENFAKGIRDCLSPEARNKAQELAKSIEAEGDGAENAVDSFHRGLPLEGRNSMRCGIFEDHVAVWEVKNSFMRLSALAADLLVENQQLRWEDLKLVRHYAWHDFQGPGEPVTGAGGAAVVAAHEAIHGLARIPENAKKDLKQLSKEKRKKQGHSVTDAMVIPGKIAYAIRGNTIESQKLRWEQENATTNLAGDAEPSKLLHPDSGVEDRLPAPSVISSDRRPTTAPGVVLKDVGEGVGHTAKAVGMMPFEVWKAMALGFRNAPRLYGDTTVRPPPNTITGMRSGLKAAGDEMWMGVYDGFSGLIRLPYIEVERDGITGLPKGIAKGFGGMTLKPLAGFFGLAAYTTQGIRASLRKKFKDTKKTERWIRRARMNQGAKDVLQFRDQERGSYGGQNNKRKQNDLESVRGKALEQWSSHEREVAEAREQEKKMSIKPLRSHKLESRAK